MEVFLSRIAQAFRAFFSLLGSGRLPDDLVTELNLTRKVTAKPAAAKPEAPAVKTTDGALQLLGILQREARLVDFVMEDIAAYSDEQVGGAVRAMHEHSRKAITQYFRIGPVIDGVEGAFTKSPAEAGNVKYLGNVPATGTPSGGTLRHRGWKVDAVLLPNIPARSDLTVLAPAELEVE